MKTTEMHVKIRPMSIWDLKDILSVDQRIRETIPSITYKNFGTEQIFGVGSYRVQSKKRPTVSEVAKLVDLGLVAEVEGKICGFVVGRQTYIAEHEMQEGEIAIIGVESDYRGKGIATKLVNSICDLFRSRDVQQVRATVDPQDKDLSAFFKQQGFRAEQRLHYTKKP